MIPKRLIYCNFGKMKMRPYLEGACIASWEKYFPKQEWEWLELNEQTYDIAQHLYTKVAYERGFYNLVADYARLDILNKIGGIYMDVDEFILQPLDNSMLNASLFIGTGLALPEVFSWGIVGATSNNHLLQEILDVFNKIPIYRINNHNLIALTESQKILLAAIHIDIQNKLPLNRIINFNNIVIYPFEYFTCMTPYEDIIYIDKIKTYGIQLYGGSWMKNSLINLKRFYKIEEFIKQYQ